MTDMSHTIAQVRELVKHQAALTLLTITQRTAVLQWCMALIETNAAPEKVLIAARVLARAIGFRSLAEVHTSHCDTLLTYLATTQRGAA